MMLGLDYVAGGQLAALPAFQEQFGVLQPDGSWLVPAKYLSAWASIGPACDIVAALIAAPFLEKYGRKPQIFVASIISVVGVLLQQLATEWKMHLAGRAVNGKSAQRGRHLRQADFVQRRCYRHHVHNIPPLDW